MRNWRRGDRHYDYYDRDRPRERPGRAYRDIREVREHERRPRRNDELRRRPVTPTYSSRGYEKPYSLYSDRRRNWRELDRPKHRRHRTETKVYEYVDDRDREPDSRAPERVENRRDDRRSYRDFEAEPPRPRTPAPGGYSRRGEYRRLDYQRFDEPEGIQRAPPRDDGRRPRRRAQLEDNQDRYRDREQWNDLRNRRATRPEVELERDLKPRYTDYYAIRENPRVVPYPGRQPGDTPVRVELDKPGLVRQPTSEVPLVSGMSKSFTSTIPKAFQENQLL